MTIHKVAETPNFATRRLAAEESKRSKDALGENITLEPGYGYENKGANNFSPTASTALEASLR